ncbi:SRPBCC family protein [Mycobacterium hubeiense]|uniref:SRPBCC family protein n=1 Tax=Mycobacterium hubeiense TaxID=1867256 RepID=UPI001E641809|nr:SRPBCC family protein [Mycobacterium sp. QGD 101]
MNLGCNWGAAPCELAAGMPCDALAPNAGTRADRAISIDAPPHIVFAWLCQLRAAPYSYDLLDNVGRRSPRQRDPQLTRLETGQRFMSMFTLESFVDGEHITLRAKDVVVTYAVTPQGHGSRLHVRVLFDGPRLLGQLLAVGDLVMMRKQLLTLKELAEREAAVKAR